MACCTIFITPRTCFQKSCDGEQVPYMYMYVCIPLVYTSAYTKDSLRVQNTTVMWYLSV